MEPIKLIGVILLKLIFVLGLLFGGVLSVHESGLVLIIYVVYKAIINGKDGLIFKVIEWLFWVGVVFYAFPEHNWLNLIPLLISTLSEGAGALLGSLMNGGINPFLVIIAVGFFYYLERYGITLGKFNTKYFVLIVLSLVLLATLLISNTYLLTDIPNLAGHIVIAFFSLLCIFAVVNIFLN